MKEAPERITLKKLWADILEQLNLERGLGYTIKQFGLRPGRASREYLYCTTGGLFRFRLQADLQAYFLAGYSLFAVGVHYRPGL